MSLEKRLAHIDGQLPRRCLTCSTALECPTCNDWKAEARAYGIDPEQLLARIQRELDVLLVETE